MAREAIISLLCNVDYITLKTRLYRSYGVSLSNLQRRANCAYIICLNMLFRNNTGRKSRTLPALPRHCSQLLKDTISVDNFLHPWSGRQGNNCLSCSLVEGVESYVAREDHTTRIRTWDAQCDCDDATDTGWW